MGDIADYMIEQMIDRATRARPHQPVSVTCKHCHTPGLWWFPQRRDSYFLKNADGTQHNCMRIREPASLDEFPQE
jgi:hypothetical protein